MAYTAPRTWTPAAILTAAQLNEQLRDNMLAAFPTSAVWATWSPSYVNLTIGNGTVVARYIQVGKLVVCRFKFVLGSTSSIGNAPTVSTPVNAHADGYGSNGPAVGIAHMRDSATDTFTGSVALNTATAFGIRVGNVAATYLRLSTITSSTPMTWATGDELTFVAVYEVA